MRFVKYRVRLRNTNFEMKKPSRRTILVHAIVLHGESFCWAAVSECELLMQISKSTRHALDSYQTRTQLALDLHSKMSSECDVTLELYRKMYVQLTLINDRKEVKRMN